MNFGEKILKNFGWKEGESLGKNKDGIAVPIKAHRKSNTLGLGATAAEATGGHWWERVFNEAANNVNVQKDNNANGGFSVTQNDEDGVEITNKSYSMKKLLDKTDVKYGSFLKASSLVGGREEEDTQRTKIEDVEKAPVQVLSDAELFKACGGLTAHKGARHGLKLSGKLSRMEEQDRLMMARVQAKPELGVFSEWTPVKSSSSSKKKKEKISSDSEDELKQALCRQEYRSTKSKRKRANKLSAKLAESIEKAFSEIGSKSAKDSEAVEAIEVEEDISALNENSKTIKKYKKKKKGKKSDKIKDLMVQQALEMINEEKIEDPEVIEPSKGKKKKKKKGKNNEEPQPIVPIEEPKSKKRKHKPLQSASEASEEEDFDQVMEQMNHLRNKRKIQRVEVLTSEFQKLHAEVAKEKGVAWEENEPTKRNKKKIKREEKKINKVAKKLNNQTL